MYPVKCVVAVNLEAVCCHPVGAMYPTAYIYFNGDLLITQMYIMFYPAPEKGSAIVLGGLALHEVSSSSLSGKGKSSLAIEYIAEKTKRKLKNKIWKKHKLGNIYALHRILQYLAFAE